MGRHRSRRRLGDRWQRRLYWINTADDGGVVASEVAWVAGVEVGAAAGAAVDVGGGAVARAVFCNESCWQAASLSAPAINATIPSRLNLMKIFFWEAVRYS